jgi:transcription elongation factor GreA
MGYNVAVKSITAPASADPVGRGYAHSSAAHEQSREDYMARQVRLTQEGYERLKQQLEQEYSRLEEATRILRELTGSSDDYDDSGLEEAKREKARLEMRIDNLEEQLNRAEIIAAHEVDKVDLGAVITLQDTASKEAFEVQVVSPLEAGVLEGEIPKVSDESPLGKALMGRKPGDTVEVVINNRRSEYTLMSIS